MKQTQVILITFGLFLGLVAIALPARGATATVSTIADRDAGVYSYWPNQNNGTDEFFIT